MSPRDGEGKALRVGLGCQKVPCASGRLNVSICDIKGYLLHPDTDAVCDVSM